MAADVGLALRQADGVKRVLVVGAHPDDEDTSLLAFLSRTRGARAVYLSLTRGEGGQNRIGDERGEELGILRSLELLAARRLDGAEQRFTRAYDFGYSRDAPETFRHWPRQEILRDVVWTIRDVRPHVVVSLFRGTEEDGHGHHRAAGRVAAEAFEAAADPGRFPGQVARGRGPWRASKLYVHARREPDDATLSIATGAIDPLLGRSPHQLAMESRSRHRSQSFGTIEPPGQHASGLRLAVDRTGAGPEASLFAGVDTTLAGLVDGLREGAGQRTAAGALAEYRRHLHAAGERLDALAPGRAVPPLLRAVRALREARGGLARIGSETAAVVDRELTRREELVEGAALTAAGVRTTFRSADDELVPGQAVRVRAETWNGGDAPVTLRETELVTPPGWEVSPCEGGEPFPEAHGPFGGTRSLPVDVGTDTTPDGGVVLPPGAVHRWDVELRVPDDAETSSPYYLRRPRRAALYRWPDEPEIRSLPFASPPVGGRTVVELHRRGPSGREDGRLTVRTPLRYRGLDRAAGEFWRDVRLVPRLSLAADPGLLVLAHHREAPAEVAVRLRSFAPDTVAGRISLEAPAGWDVDPPARRFAVAGEGRDTTVSFLLRPPPAPDGGRERIRIAAVATLPSGERLASEVRTVDHPHVQRRRRTAPAGLTAMRLPLRVGTPRVGFVAGPSRTTADAVRRLGLEVEHLAEDDWRPERLEDLDVVVLGVRAYETRPDLRAANALLLEWVRRGGVLIVQYNRYDYVGRTFAPYPLRVDRPPVRVTEEEAEVRLLEPDAPVFVRPNRIDRRDFEGWVQERATFMPRSWDDRYRALLSMADAGEPEARGALLVARVGQGLYAHVTLSLFRQLEAAVPGAYRILANLLSLEPTDWPTAGGGSAPAPERPDHSGK